MKQSTTTKPIDQNATALNTKVEYIMDRDEICTLVSLINAPAGLHGTRVNSTIIARFIQFGLATAETTDVTKQQESFRKGLVERAKNARKQLKAIASTASHADLQNLLTPIKDAEYAEKVSATVMGMPQPVTTYHATDKARDLFGVGQMIIRLNSGIRDKY